MTRPITSHSVLDIINGLAGNRHLVVIGDATERVLWRDQPMTVSEFLIEFGRATRDVVVTLNALDEGDVVHGEDRFGFDDDPMADPLDDLRTLHTNADLSAMTIFSDADIRFQDPDIHDLRERTAVATVLQMMAAETTSCCVFLIRRLNSLPVTLRSNAGRVAVAEIGATSREERTVRINQLHQAGAIQQAEGTTAEESDEAIVTLARLTEGESLRGLEALAHYSINAQVPYTRAHDLVREYRHGRSPDYWAPIRTDFTGVASRIREGVIGQDRAMDKVVAALAAASLGLYHNGDPNGTQVKPRGTLLLAGPTGVGKTETAKVLAKVIFGDESAYTRFDMSQFPERHSAERLVGSPPGYVGYEQGGQLTEAVRTRPFQVILLDEIEKAHPSVFLRLMSIIDDGVVTDAQGRVVHFSETVFLMTTNMGTDALEAAAPQGDYTQLTADQVETTLTSAVQRHFRNLGQPEIFGRLAGDLVIFQPLRPDAIDPITRALVRKTGWAHGPEINIDEDSAVTAIQERMTDPQARRLGGRMIRTNLTIASARMSAWLAESGNLSAHTLDVTFLPPNQARLVPDGDVSRSATIEVFPTN